MVRKSMHSGKSEPIERSILRYGLMIGIAFQAYQTALSFFPDVPQMTMVANVSITLLLFGLLWLSRKQRYVPLVAMALHVVALAGFSFFWVLYGGLSGTVPSFMCFYVIFVIVTSRGVARLAMMAILLSVITLFIAFPEAVGMAHYMEPENINKTQLAVDYLIVALIITFFMMFMKNRFLFYRNRVIHRQEQLTKIARTLEGQNRELEARQEEIRVINENLESIVDMRTREIQEKNVSLSEFAFINAHMLRGPLCRIIGILSLMEHEQDQFDQQQVAALKKMALEIDHKVQTISDVVS